MILFEAGIFTTSLNTQMFQVSFVRQFSNEDEEFLKFVYIFYMNPTMKIKCLMEQFGMKI